MSLPLLLISIAAAGALILAGAAVVARRAGGDMRTARRLAGPREVPVGSAFEAGVPLDRPVRLAGRIRCRDPLRLPDGERLVAYHRDVEALLPGAGWRSLERMREARSFQLWDHGGALSVDPAMAAEPLVVIPQVWRGDPSELSEPHASALRQLEQRHGAHATEARAVTRTVNVTDRLLVLGRLGRSPDGSVTLEPPEGGYVITNVGLDDAMRLLGGRRRRLVAVAVVVAAIGGILAIGGVAGAAIAVAIGA